MKKSIRLKKLSLTNYRNLEHIELDFDGSDAAIVGENHIGKTNCLESLFVLLDDALMNGSANLPSIKPISDTKKVAAIDATFDVDGEEYSVKKEYGEDWVKTRGTKELVMKGHYENLYIQGTKAIRTKDFERDIRDRFGMPADPSDKIDLFRLLLNPTYLGEMGEGKDWTALRAFVIKLVGDVSDADVFAANPESKVIEDDLKKQGGSIETLKRRYKQDADGMGVTITQDEAIISNLESTNKPTDEAVAIAKKGIEDHEDAIAALRNSDSDVESERLQRELSEAQNELIKAQSDANSNYTDPNEEKRNKLREDYLAARRAMNEAIDKKAEKQGEIARHERTVRDLMDARASTDNAALVARIREIDATDPVVEDICPTCGQPLPADKVAEAKAKAKQALAKEREEKVARCKDNKAKRNEIDAKAISEKTVIAAIQDEIEKLDEAINGERSKMEKAQSENDAIPSAGPRQETEVEKKAKAKVDEISQKLRDSRAAFAAGRADANSAIIAHQEAEKPFKATLDDLAYYERQMASLKKKREELEEHRKALASIEQKREAANSFLYAKLRMLDENVAKVFGNIKIKLIQENINGGFDPVCKPYIYDSVRGESTKVSWSGGSKSEKVETGIAICEAIKKAMDLPDLPYLFDEGGEISAETFATRLRTDSQRICVKVRDGIMTPTVMPL